MQTKKRADRWRREKCAGAKEEAYALDIFTFVAHIFRRRSYIILHITFVYPMRKTKMVYDFFVLSFLILARKHIAPFPIPWHASLISTKPALSRIRYWPWFFYVIFFRSARSRLVHRSFESLSDKTSFYFRTQFFFLLDIRGINSRVCVVFSASLYNQQQ